MLNIANPRQTVLVTSREEAEILGRKEVKDNIVAVDWHMPLSFDPSMYGICLARKRFSYELISKSGVFVVNFIPATLEKEALFCGRHSGKHMDKFRKAGLTKEEAEKVDCARIKEAAAFIECELAEEKDTGDHVLLIGRVVMMGMKKKAKRLFHLTGDEFTTTEESKETETISER